MFWKKDPNPSASRAALARILPVTARGGAHVARGGCHAHRCAGVHATWAWRPFLFPDGGVPPAAPWRTNCAAAFRHRSGGFGVPARRLRRPGAAGDGVAIGSLRRPPALSSWWIHAAAARYGPRSGSTGPDGAAADRAQPPGAVGGPGASAGWTGPRATGDRAARGHHQSDRAGPARRSCRARHADQALAAATQYPRFRGRARGQYPLPGNRGPGTPWCTIAGRFVADGQPWLAGLILRADRPNNLSQATLEHEAQWLEVLRCNT